MKIDRLRSLGIRITSITNTIHVVHGNHRSRWPFANAILILDRTCALMDAGCGLDIIKKLSQALEIEIVIASHSHPDHTAGIWMLQDLSHPDVYVPKEHFKSISQADRLAERFVGKDLAQLWKDTYLGLTGFKDFLPTQCFAHNQEFSFGDTRFIALHTPGHIEDHYCFFEPEKKVVVGFDIDLSPFGPWYGNPESDIAEFNRSIETVSKLPAEVYLTSHSRPVKGTYISQRFSKYQKAFAERDKIILAGISCHEWSKTEDIVMKSPIYQADHNQPDRILKYGETQMVMKHLAGLVAQGRITKLEEKYRKAL
jgi:glyoxylase-like metal-dependent hydrolase (beta-lactamase superfamily II)